MPLVGHVESKQRCRLKLELQRGEGESNWRTHLNPFWHCLLAIGAHDLIPCDSCLNNCRSKAYPGNLDLYCNLRICFCFRPPRGVGAASIVFSCSSSFRPTYLPHSLTDCLEFRAFQPYIPNQNLTKPYLTYPTYLTYLPDLPPHLPIRTFNIWTYNLQDPLVHNFDQVSQFQPKLTNSEQFYNFDQI